MNQVEVPGPKFGLNEIIDAFTMEVIKKRNEGDKYNPLRPSGAGKCTRELGYEFMEFRGLADYAKEPKPPEVHRLLNLGHKVEQHMLDEMYQAFRHSPKPIKIKYKQQTVTICRMPDGSLLEGSLDFVIESGEWKTICDAKSKKDKYSQFYKTDWDGFIEKLVSTGYAVQFGDGAVYITDLEKLLATEIDVFFFNNLYQLNMYANTDFCKERGINLASIMQYNKNDSRQREIRFTPSPIVNEKIIEKFSKVMTVVDTEKSIESLRKDYVLGSMKCGFCDFRKQCWPEDDALKAYFKNLPPKQWAKDLDRLPKEARDTLTYLFDQYEAYTEASGDLEKVEQKIISTLSDNKVYKVKLNNGRVYKVKRLKSGGPGGNGRMVLRRDKV